MTPRDSRWLPVAVPLAVAALALRADPYVGAAYPSGIQAGTTNRIVVCGQRFWGLSGGWVSGDGVEVVKVEKVPNFGVPNGKGQRAWLDRWVYGIVDGKREMPSLGKVADADLAGWTRCAWWETMSSLPPLEFSLVARNLFTPRNALQMSPSLAERAIVTVAARPDAPPGVRRLILFDSRGASAPRPFVVTAEPRVAEPLYAPPFRKDDWRKEPEPPLAVPPAVLDGQILPGETDVFRLSLTGGARLVCEVTGRELTPYLGDAVPGFFNPVLRLTDGAGRELAFADDWGYLPDPVLVCEIPSNGVYRLEIRDNLYRGRADFVYSIACRTDGRPPASVAARAFAVAPRPEPPAAADGGLVWSGSLDAPGAVAERTIEIDAPGEWTFSLFARRLGSPLDGVVRLEGPLTGLFWKTGPVLATWDDVTNAVFVGSVPQAECDPVGRWTFAEPGTYRVTVADRVGAGGEGYDFTLCAGPSEPSFAAFATKSSFVLPPGRWETLKFDVRIVRAGGFAGPVALDGGADWKLAPAQVAATADVVRVTATPLRREKTGVREFRFSARAETVPGTVRTVPIVPADEVEQAFAYTHLLPSEAFRILVKPQTLPPAEKPTWLEMPCDRFLPRRVIRPHAEAPGGALTGASLAALAKVDIPVVSAPADAEEGVLAAKFATSAAHVRPGRTFPAVAFEPAADDAARLAAHAVLAGIERFVGPNLDYRDGAARRVRTFARAADLPHDNDVLVYVPTNAVDPLAGAVGRVARQLREAGWSFDYVTDGTLARAAFGRVYRAVVAPDGPDALPEETRQKLAKLAKKKTISLVDGTGRPKAVNGRLSERCRRDTVPPGVRFARFGQVWGEGWYFVHNPTAETRSGAWRFAIRGQAKTAFAMDVATGRVEPLARRNGPGAARFDFALGPGASAWIYVTVREAK